MIKIQIVACDIYVRYLYVYHPVITNIIGIYFSTKSYLKNTRNHSVKNITMVCIYDRKT
jgi:hypothetical protein